MSTLPTKLVIDLQGPLLSDRERQCLKHPAVSGVILFTKNFNNKTQIAELIEQIRLIKSSDIEISVDQEGGRVQRFRNGFSELPPLADYGERWQTEPATALQEAYQHGLTVGSECAAVGVDVVFSPVVDLDYGISEVIGNRAFHRRPEVVADLAAAMMRGLHDGGVTAVAKHFPGHGGVEADSHLQFAIDQREREQIEEDLYPYQKLIAAGLRAVMMAHVCFPRIDSQPAGYSAYWVEQLRGNLGFTGTIYSDDLSMAGAKTEGSLLDRVMAADRAGCDRLLLCNCADEVVELLGLQA